MYLSFLVAIQELMYKIREIKTKAEQSETMIQEICRDIKKLDFAKKHITTTITALHRLTVLVSAVEQLQVMASKRQYKEAAAQLEEETWDIEEGSQNNVLNSSMQSEEFAESVSKLIDPQLADAVDMSDVQDEFSAVIAKASVTLVLGLETKFDAEMAAMTRVP
ncbi:hypothetical protein EZV62_013266 [Acer yangbiense]|uniref:Vps53 N-terminal domain-containing protein n=1 Tax=Acer yangbiense TaxID=1000413 RepID=A0A5C7HXQ7_9ROSI|nr:hypothetical protein EZV62_013266 [Acer yangbiense]